jgi:hypothetical protein
VKGGYLSIRGGIILKFILNCLWKCRMDSFGSEQGPVVGSCELSNEPSGYIKVGEFLDLQLSLVRNTMEFVRS